MTCSAERFQSVMRYNWHGIFDGCIPAQLVLPIATLLISAIPKHHGSDVTAGGLYANRADSHFFAQEYVTARTTYDCTARIVASPFSWRPDSNRGSLAMLEGPV